MRKLSYAEMRKQGICTSCGKQNPTPEKSMCPECFKRAYENRRKNREYLERINVCTRCGKNQAEPHKKWCYECLGAEQDRYAAHGRTDAARENDRIRKRDNAEKRIEMGLCPKCGKRKGNGGGLCGRCRAYLKKYRDRNRQDILRSERPVYGICYICGKQKAMSGKKVCEDCYETRLQTLPAMWANMDNEYFRQLEYARITKERKQRDVKD